MVAHQALDRKLPLLVVERRAFQPMEMGNGHQEAVRSAHELADLVFPDRLSICEEREGFLFQVGLSAMPGIGRQVRPASRSNKVNTIGSDPDFTLEAIPAIN